MSSIDTSLFLDVADALGISSPAIVEKDCWVIQLLKDISKLEPKGYRLVFCGGTCLAKAHRNTFRMSEDIDIKMVPDEKTFALSKSEQRKLRREIHQLVTKLVGNSERFTLATSPTINNVYKYQQFLIEYPRDRDSLN